MVRTALLVAILVSPTISVAPAAAGKRGPATQAQLKRAQRVTIQYLPSTRNPKKKTRLVLTKKKQIRALVSKMSFRSVRPCRCKHKYRIVFQLSANKSVTVYSFSHGWRFQPDSVRQRRDSGRLIRHLDRLFGIPKGRYYL